jgi:hypothetical protein
LPSALDRDEKSASALAALLLEKSLQYPLDRRMGRPQSQTGCYVEGKDLAPDENQTLAVQPIAQYPYNVKINYYDYDLILARGDSNYTETW